MEHDLGPDDIAEIIIRMSDKESHVVDNRHMAEINLQHLTSVMVLDRTVSFATAHDDARMEAADIQAMKKRITLTPESNLPRRQPIIDIVTSAGRTLNHRTMAVRGTPANPMDQQEVADKAFDLLSDILGADKATGLIEQVWNIEQVSNVRDLRDFMMPQK